MRPDQGCRNSTVSTGKQHLAEVHEGGRAPLLLLLAMDVLDGDVNIVEQLCVVLHAVARAEEHHHLHSIPHRVSPTVQYYCSTTYSGEGSW